MNEQPALRTQNTSRILPIVLSVLAPGLGHALVGRARRGVVWLLAPLVLFIVFLVFAREPSPLKIFGALALAVLVGYVAAVVDVALIPVATYRARSILGMIAFVIAPVVLAPVVAIALRVFVLEAFKVPSGAMAPSVLVGDHLFVDKTAYRNRAVKRGEVFVFHFPEVPSQDFIKRAIAVGGDTLEVRGGHAILNGWKIPYCRVGEYRYTDDATVHEGELFVEFLEDSAYFTFLERGTLGSEQQGPFRIRDGDTWVLGDNRNNSHDSRMWFGGQGGGVPASLVVGRARTIWMSPNPAHEFTDLASDPVAPSPDLAAGLAECLAKRPARAQTTPPAAP
jgi:signal peptidase I